MNTADAFASYVQFMLVTYSFGYGIIAAGCLYFLISQWRK